MSDRDDDTNSEPVSDNLPAPTNWRMSEILDELHARLLRQAFWQMSSEEREGRRGEELNRIARAGRQMGYFVDPPIDAAQQLTAEARIDIGIRLTVNKLKEIRAARGMTIAQVAGLMGVDKSVVSKFENGPADPRLSTLLRYAQAVHAAVLVSPIPELDTSSLDAVADRLRFSLRPSLSGDRGPRRRDAEHRSSRRTKSHPDIVDEISQHPVADGEDGLE